MTTKIQDPKDIFTFLFAGNARFELRSSVNAFTYEITRPQDDDGTWGSNYYVSVETAGGKMVAVGVIYGETVDSHYPELALRGKGRTNPAFSSAVMRLVSVLGDVQFLAEPRYDVRHFGCCGHCGKEMTSGASNARGIGRDCREEMGIGR
jgi:hypothetical protein